MKKIKKKYKKLKFRLEMQSEDIRVINLDIQHLEQLRADRIRAWNNVVKALVSALVTIVAASYVYEVFFK